MKAARVTSLSRDLAARTPLSVGLSTYPREIRHTALNAQSPEETGSLREILTHIRSQSMALTLALGKDIGGKPVTVDLGRMPHLLVAGTTGAGKSVALNAMILSLLYKAPVKDVRLIMIDPKMLELSVYEGIPRCSPRS